MIHFSVIMSAALLIKVAEITFEMAYLNHRDYSMDNLLQGCCIFFLYFLTSSTKGIFLKSTEFHYIDKLVIPSILYGFFGQPTTRDHSEQQEESKSMWLEGLDPPFTTVAMKAF